ncbi:MAG: hypothetical protein ACLFWL_17575 [Candidatus Brocadiia bacterium]
MKKWMIFAFVLFVSVMTLTAKEGSDKWPEVLTIDNFEDGIERWKNEDTGKLESLKDAVQGERAMRWTAADDGLGHIIFRNLKREEIDFSQYDLLVCEVKIAGKPIWNLNPIVQQRPAVYGFRGLYYSIDRLHPFGRWFTLSQDLSRWENAWPDSYNATNQEFQFEVHQLAGPGSTQIYLDNIRLMKNPLALRPSYPGKWLQQPDGSQLTEFAIPLENTGEKALTVQTSVAQGGTLDRFKVELPDPVEVSPTDSSSEEARRTLRIRIKAPAPMIDEVTPWYGETARIAVTAKEAPGLVLYTDLAAGTKPARLEHPSIVCSPERMADLRKRYSSEDSRKKMKRAFRNIARRGEQALSYKPEYPPVAAQGRTKDPISGKRLVEIDVPNRPQRVYQDPSSGRSYSGPLYDAGMQGWKQKHLKNAAVTKSLGLAFVVTGRREFAEKAAAILRPYIKVYPDLPLIAPRQGSPVGSVTSGTVPIGSTYMRERTWLTSMAIGLDCIRPAGVLSAEDLRGLAENVFSPSAHNMMDHKVGPMNLQWMIQSASLMAGLAAELPDVTARALHDSHGIVRLTEVGFLDDGNWWENPSYQNVAKIAAYPALVTAIHNEIIPWNERFQTILKASYKLYGPDGRSPTLGTGGWTSYGMDNAAIAALAEWITDPELAWVAYNRKPRPHRNIGLLALFRDGKPRVPEGKAVSPIPDKTTLAPDYGGISLRIPGTDRYSYFHFGRELTHGHHNKLSINAYGKKGWYARNVMGGYGHNFDDFLQTSASASSIMVDGADADHDTGELLFHGSIAGTEVASGREIGAWKDVEHERTLVLTESMLIVIDRCLSESKHVYDWLHHTNRCGLKLDKTNVGKPRIERFGKSVHYDSLPPTGRFTDNRPARWDRENGSGLLTASLPVGTRYVTRITHTYRNHDSILWRQTGKTMRFAAAFRPLGKGESGKVQIESVPVVDAAGKKVGLEDGQAVQARSDRETLTVLVNYSGNRLNAGPVSTKQRVGVKREK